MLVRTEPWGVWSDGERAALRLPVSPRATHDLTLRLTLQGFIARPFDAQRVTVRINDARVAALTARRSGFGEDYIVIPQRLYSPGDVNVIAFELPDAQAAAIVGSGADPRRLAIGLQKIEVLYNVTESYEDE